MDNQQYRAGHPDVVAEIIDGEAIIIHMTTGCYYSLEGVACAIWEQLESGPISVDGVTACFEGDAAIMQAEILSFLEELVAENLITSESASSPAGAAPDIPVSYAKPVLNKYTDMENLLLMDPIHDVSDQGWPEKPSEEK